jgi:hypothetical protein
MPQWLADTAKVTAVFERMVTQFNCPITHAPMVDPVILEDGNTYERAAISPTEGIVIPNLFARTIIDQWRAHRGLPIPERPGYLASASQMPVVTSGEMRDSARRIASIALPSGEQLSPADVAEMMADREPPAVVLASPIRTHWNRWTDGIEHDEWNTLIQTVSKTDEELRNPKFTVGSETLTLDNLNVGDKYEFSVSNYSGGPIIRVDNVTITSIDFREDSETFNATLNINPDGDDGDQWFLQIIFSKPGTAQVLREEVPVGWTILFRRGGPDPAVFKRIR